MTKATVKIETPDYCDYRIVYGDDKATCASCETLDEAAYYCRTHERDDDGETYYVMEYISEDGEDYTYTDRYWTYDRETGELAKA